MNNETEITQLAKHVNLRFYFEKNPNSLGIDSVVEDSSEGNDNGSKSTENRDKVENERCRILSSSKPVCDLKHNVANGGVGESIGKRLAWVFLVLTQFVVEEERKHAYQRSPWDVLEEPLERLSFALLFLFVSVHSRSAGDYKQKGKNVSVNQKETK